MKKRIKKQKKQDNQILIYILLIFVFVGATAGSYFLFGQKNITPPPKQVQETKPAPVQKPVQQPIAQLPQKPTEQPQPVKVEEKKPAVKVADFEKYKFRYTYSFNVQGNVKELKAVLPIPQDEKEKQYLTDFNISIQPTRVYKKDGSTIGEFIFTNIGTQKINLVLEGTAKVRTYNLKTAKALNHNHTPETDLSRYLKPEKLIESNDPYIINIASTIKGNSREEIVQNIYKYIQNRMTYKIISGNAGAKKALTQRYGKCSEYSASMVALCRAKKIPARIVIGNIAREERQPHAWVEVYYDKYGWVSYDPTKLATLVHTTDNTGKIIKTEKRYDTSTDELRYVTSGRNLLNQIKMGYSTMSTSKGRVSLTEKIQIKKLD